MIIVFFGGVMRKFEKVSYDEYKREVGGSMEDYNSYHLPKRSTNNSAVMILNLLCRLYFTRVKLKRYLLV